MGNHLGAIEHALEHSVIGPYKGDIYVRCLVGLV